ncbi:hypothetical protein HYFRA_00006949 [Hymenoscyphus fraxineus]|uniref:Heterokaryon incompatibility domain-containing protein n=1 Tax=Hymenoscyphus fraxineus TaxID=746836 RepID=A0A9N9PPA4_9HELO|nr:hypothetical protein HYFRA_00006949 [Hymenoscyphus fraxineus]
MSIQSKNLDSTNQANLQASIFSRINSCRLNGLYTPKSICGCDRGELCGYQYQESLEDEPVVARRFSFRSVNNIDSDETQNKKAVEFGNSGEDCEMAITLAEGVTCGTWARAGDPSTVLQVLVWLYFAVRSHPTEINCSQISLQGFHQNIYQAYEIADEIGGFMHAMDTDISSQDPPHAESQNVAISPQLPSNTKETYKYQYSPLKSQSQFRLIAFHREEQDDPRAERLNCELAHFSLDDTAPRYRALSYEWGFPSDDDPRIWINGMPHIIRKNLFCAMLELHSGQRGETKYGTPHWIWIDALCINQEDLLERNEQVSIMGRIYGSAESVIIWLGVAKDDSDMIMDILGENHDPQLIYRLSHEEKKDALLLWLQRPYWNRIWIRAHRSDNYDSSTLDIVAVVEWQFYYLAFQHEFRDLESTGITYRGSSWLTINLLTRHSEPQDLKTNTIRLDIKGSSAKAQLILCLNYDISPGSTFTPKALRNSPFKNRFHLRPFRHKLDKTAPSLDLLIEPLENQTSLQKSLGHPAFAIPACRYTYFIRKRASNTPHLRLHTAGTPTTSYAKEPRTPRICSTTLPVQTFINNRSKSTIHPTQKSLEYPAFALPKDFRKQNNLHSPYAKEPQNAPHLHFRTPPVRVTRLPVPTPKNNPIFTCKRASDTPAFATTFPTEQETCQHEYEPHQLSEEWIDGRDWTG